MYWSCCCLCCGWIGLDFWFCWCSWMVLFFGRCFVFVSSCVFWFGSWMGLVCGCRCCCVWCWFWIGVYVLVGWWLWMYCRNGYWWWCGCDWLCYVVLFYLWLFVCWLLVVWCRCCWVFCYFCWWLVLMGWLVLCIFWLGMFVGFSSWLCWSGMVNWLFGWSWLCFWICLGRFILVVGVGCCVWGCSLVVVVGLWLDWCYFCVCSGFVFFVCFLVVVVDEWSGLVCVVWCWYWLVIVCRSWLVYLGFYGLVVVSCFGCLVMLLVVNSLVFVNGIGVLFCLWWCWNGLWMDGYFLVKYWYWLGIGCYYWGWFVVVSDYVYCWLVVVVLDWYNGFVCYDFIVGVVWYWYYLGWLVRFWFCVFFIMIWLVGLGCYGFSWCCLGGC